MANSRGWQSIIRFKDAQGKVRFGDPNSDLTKATIWEGSDVLQLSKTENTAEVKEVGYVDEGCFS